MKKYFVLFSLLSLVHGAAALDLKNAKFPLFYECHKEQSAGLYTNRSTGNVEATQFSVDRSDRWQMKIDVIRKVEDLKSLPYKCTNQRNARIAATGKNPFNASQTRDKLFEPEYCATFKYSAGTESIKISQHCKLAVTGDGEIFCGITDSFFFDSDRLIGFQTDDSLKAFRYGFVKTATVESIACIRMDR
ncbi:MAG: hypothetical protein P8N60_14745 [Burkholderiaceae bacterium]|nr:hypothetical protein [Burkholderiaceae bacterium]